MNVQTRKDLIYSKECYKIIGLIFNIFNEFGYGHKEKFYQEVIAEVFRENRIEFKEQLKVKLKYRDKDLGLYFFDFLVFGKIVIEIKQRNYFSKKDIEQIYAYLRATRLNLGLLVHFTKSGIRYKRIVNLQ